ncbi:hypothetical protein Glove_156g8 [Diversispora epigaea]|uniref:Uncharacterized protein n=1 Tax=Diversispora epigaea TaxID=1348612 RepID=A0A397J100_9GLOM|nr:hypothetical protein Glove_156g8 [Diversispora epigaea]
MLIALKILIGRGLMITCAYFKNVFIVLAPTYFSSSTQNLTVSTVTTSNMQSTSLWLRTELLDQARNHLEEKNGSEQGYKANHYH